MSYLSKYFQLENGPPTELSMDNLRRALESYQPSENIFTKDYSESTFKADPINADAGLGTGTFEHEVSNAPEESGQMFNTQRCLWVDKLSNKICGDPVPAGLKAILDHLNRKHGVRGGEKEEVVCRWASDSGGVCGEQFQRRNVPRHMGAHLCLRYPCQHCSKDFARSDLLRDHVREKHPV